MILNCIRLWGSSFGTAESVEYFFIAIIPRFILTRYGSTCNGPIYTLKSLETICIQLDRVQKASEKNKYTNIVNVNV